ncbi:hypothetical protein K4H28_14205 [Deefgea tanakiae]|uniref:Uncharacterized protein n=1 Tax=Deefgea tanakiae TaxID=2865840 RepID=A0ABX8Z945_9NEIS|nr:hypothetical protein [Deefgea tanakiae]QZA77419.1 hypothetical protein K4H28_14205 [Deefgea tanakiae]
MFRILAVLLGLCTLYIQITSDEAMSLLFVTFAVVFLVYGLGGKKWLAKIDARFHSGFNENPIEEYKKLMKNEVETPPKS